MRFPTPATLVSRPSYLLLLIPCTIILHLTIQAASLSAIDSTRVGVVDDRVGWSVQDDYGSSSSGSSSGSSLGMKAGAALTGLGNRLGRLTGGRTSSPSRTSTASASFFQRTGGSLYELVVLSPSYLYDARRSLDKLRLTSTRFVTSNPPEPMAVFSSTPERQHILVTGGFTPLGKSLVRDLLLLGSENGMDELESTSTAGSDSKKGGFGSWWGGAADDDTLDEFQTRPGSKGTPDFSKKVGIIVTLLDSRSKSEELDDMLKHAPLYHRSRVGFNLPVGDAASGESDQGSRQGGGTNRNDDGTPPLEFIDPRSAAFSSSEVSLQSFIQKGRLKIVKGDSRNATLISAILNPPTSVLTEETNAQKSEKTKFGFKKRPHRVEDEAFFLPPVSGVFHLDGYETSDCIYKNPRDCADLERGGVKNLADALEKMPASRRPWVVLSDRGNLDSEVVTKWLKSEAAEPANTTPMLSTTTSILGADSTPVLSKRSKSDAALAPAPLSAARKISSSAYLEPLEEMARKSKVHGLSLRIPPDAHIFGDSFASRFTPIPYLVHSAIGHLPIVLNEDNFPYMSVSESLNATNPEGNVVTTKSPFNPVWEDAGVVYIEDLVETFIAAGELLSRSNSVEYLDRMAILAEIEVLPPPHKGTTSRIANTGALEGPKSLARDTLDWILQLTKSSSPVGYVRKPPAELGMASGSETAGSKRAIGGSRKVLDRTLSKRILGTAPSTPLPLALKSYIRSLLGRQTSHLVEKINHACAPPPDLRTLNDALAQLDTCSVQILGMVQSENTVLACNPAYKKSNLVSPLVLAPAVPYTEEISQVKLKSKWGPVGKVEIGFFCPFGPNGADEQIVWLENTESLEDKWATQTEAKTRAAANSAIWTYDAFEVSFVRRDTRSFLLHIPNYPHAEPGSPKRRMVFAYSREVKADSPLNERLIIDWQLLTETGPEYQNMEWRVNPLLCATKDVREINGFTFLREDPLLTSQVLYPSSDGATTVAESTYEVQRCRDFRSAHEYSRKLNLWNERSNPAKTCPRSTSEGSDWILHDLPTCSIDCEAPISCLVTDKCRCSRDRCPDQTRRTSGEPTEPVQFSQELSYRYGKQKSNAADEHVVKPNAQQTLGTLRQQVDALPWETVILPGARQAFSLPLSALPKGHVVDLEADVDTHLNHEACYDLTKAEVPTVGDHLLTIALQERSAVMEDADFAFVPYYQGCYYNYIKDNTYKKLADSVASSEAQIVLSDRLRASNIVIPFTHDWGSCTGWWSHVEDVLSRRPPPPMSKAISWQVNGDLNTRCVKAERDVVMPAVTKNSPALVAAYGDVNAIIPARQRKHLAFFSGDVKGYGAFARVRLGRNRKAGVQTEDILYQALAQGTDYIGTLGQSKFCLLPRGIAGWSSRAFDAIYAGCIPVFIADKTSFPFASILSYSAFSLTMPENDLYNLEATLRAVPQHQIDLMQVALLKIRDAFMFSDNPSKEWNRRGPLYYILLEMSTRLSVEWPTLPVHNFCKTP